MLVIQHYQSTLLHITFEITDFHILLSLLLIC